MCHLPISTVCFSDDSTQASLSNAHSARILTRATWSSSYERYGARMFFRCAQEWYAPARILLHCSQNLSISHSSCLLCHFSHTRDVEQTHTHVSSCASKLTIAIPTLLAHAPHRVSASSAPARGATNATRA